MGRDGRPMGTKPFVWIAMALLVAVPMLPAASAAGTPMKFGFSVGGYDAMTNAGAKPEYVQVWVTERIINGGWSAVDAKLKFAKDHGATAVVEWYYWGSKIGTSCVSYGCDGKSRTEWYAMTDSLMRHIQASGADAIVVVETEFNHNGVDSSTYAPKMDGYLRIVEDKIHAGGSEVAIGFGTWGTDKWGRFPKAIAGADYVGFQAMGGSTRQTKDSYLRTDEKIETTARFIRDNFGKPSLLHDVSMASYPHPDWLYVQEDFMEQLTARFGTLASLGVVGVVYREYKDSGLNYEYYGPAEGYMGLFKKDGVAKPAFKDWVDGIKAHRSGTTTSTTTSTTSTPTTTTTATTASTAFDAKFSDVGGNNWWVEVDVDANQAVAGVDARVNGGTWVPLTKQSWGDWARSFSAPDGSIQFRARSTGGATDYSSTYAWNP